MTITIEQQIDEISLENSKLTELFKKETDPVKKGELFAKIKGNAAKCLGLSNVLSDKPGAQLTKESENFFYTNSKFDSFKALSGSVLDNVTKKLGFLNPTKSWYDLGKTIGIKVKPMNDFGHVVFNSFFEKYKKARSKKEAFVTKVEQVGDDLSTYIYAYGEAKQIKELKKTYGTILNICGFEVEELSFKNKLDLNNLGSKQALSERVLNTIKDNLGVSIQDGKVLFDFAEKATDQTKFDLITKLFLPKLDKETKLAESLKESIEELKSHNKYYDLLNKFAKQNNLTTETVVFLLEKDDAKLLEQTIDKKEILKYKEDVLSNFYKIKEVEERVSMNLSAYHFIKEKSGNFIKNLNIDDDIKDEFFNESKNEESKAKLSKSKQPILSKMQELRKEFSEYKKANTRGMEY